MKEVIEGSTAKITFCPNLVNEFTLGTWSVEGPFHMLWTQWMVSLIHLRGEFEGQKAKFQFPSATHELIIISVNTREMGKLDPEVVAEDLKPGQLLSPEDVIQQFVAQNDTHAIRIVEHLLEHVAAGQLSPDQDHRKKWKELLRESEWSFLCTN